MDSRAKIKQEKNKFEQYLKTSGLKLSEGRELVFNEVMRAHGHFAAEDLVKQCREKNIKVSRATVYRSLHEMLETGVIRETAFGDKHKHFEHIYDEKPHHHACCIHCHSILEFPDLKEDTVYHPYLKTQGFHILGHEMHFYGVCKKCSQKEKHVSSKSRKT